MTLATVGVAVAIDHIAPAARDIGLNIGGQGLEFVSFVAFLAVEVALDVAAGDIEATQIEFVVEPFHLAQGVGNKIFVADFGELALGYQMACGFEAVVHPGEGAKDLFLDRLEIGNLQAVGALEAAPKVDGGGENDIGVADNVDETGLGEKLEQSWDAPGMSRAFENHAAFTGGCRPGTFAQKAQENPFPALAFVGWQIFHFVGQGVLWLQVGEGDAPIGRGSAQHGEGEFIFLRFFPAGGHRVHGALAGEHEIQIGFEGIFREEEMVGIHASVGGGIAVAWILDEQFVQQRGAGAPVADDEERILGEGCLCGL